MRILKAITTLLMLCLITFNTTWAAEDDVVKVGDLVQINLPGEASLNKGFQVDKRTALICQKSVPFLLRVTTRLNFRTSSPTTLKLYSAM